VNLKKLLSGTLAVTLAAYGVAWAATQTLTLGASTGPGGILTLFGSTSGSFFLQPPAAAGTASGWTVPSGVTDFSGTSGFLQQATTGAAITAAAITAAQVPATPLVAGTGAALVGPREYYVCTGTCTPTPPVPVAGYEFCIYNDNNVATAITLQALGSSAMYENSARTAYGTAGTGTLALSAAAANKVCIVGRDATHYSTVSYNGTVTVN
jgi:hypothetical protein